MAFVQQELATGHFATSLAASEFLPFDATRLAVLVEVADHAIEDGKVTEVKSLLEQKMFPTSAECSAIGEPSSGVLARKTLFEDMRKMAKSNKLRGIIDDCIWGIDGAIQTQIRADQEILNPRS